MFRVSRANAILSLLNALPGLVRHSDETPAPHEGLERPVYLPRLGPWPTMALLVLKQAVSSAWLFFPSVFKWLNPSHHLGHCSDVNSLGLPVCLPFKQKHCKEGTHCLLNCPLGHPQCLEWFWCIVGVLWIFVKWMNSSTELDRANFEVKTLNYVTSGPVVCWRSNIGQIMFLLLTWCVKNNAWKRGQEHFRAGHWDTLAEDTDFSAKAWQGPHHLRLRPIAVPCLLT